MYMIRFLQEGRIQYLETNGDIQYSIDLINKQIMKVNVSMNINSHCMGSYSLKKNKKTVLYKENLSLSVI